MAQQINDNFQNYSPKSLDNKYLKLGQIVYVSTVEVNSVILSPYRSRGLTVLIDTGSGPTEYWYRDGILDINLIPKVYGRFGIEDGIIVQDRVFDFAGFNFQWNNVSTGVIPASGLLGLDGSNNIIKGNYIPALLHTQIAFGDINNLMTSSSNLIYDDGAETIFNNGIGATSTHALNLYNTTAATLGVPVQKSGMIEFGGSRFAGGVLSNSFWDIENIPSATGNTGNLTFSHATTSTGVNKFAIMTIQGGATSSGNVVVNANLFANTQVLTPSISSTTYGSILEVQGVSFYGGTGDMQLHYPLHISADNGYKLWVKGDALMNGLNLTQVATPSIASITQFAGTGGSTTYKYKVVAVLRNGQTSEASAEFTYSTGNATLVGNSILIVINYSEGAYQYKVYRTFSGGTPASLGYVGTVNQNVAGGVNSFVDGGLAGDASTPPPTNTTGNLIVSVVQWTPMTQAQRTAIVEPLVGMEVYQSDGTEGVYVYKSDNAWHFAY